MKKMNSTGEYLSKKEKEELSSILRIWPIFPLALLLTFAMVYFFKNAYAMVVYGILMLLAHSYVMLKYQYTLARSALGGAFFLMHPQSLEHKKSRASTIFGAVFLVLAVLATFVLLLNIFA